MAVYRAEQVGVKAPSTGFQQGGWYNGRQFWNGTLSDPGVIHPESNQQGAGHAVSNEVIAQTNPNNVAYVQQQRQQAGVLTPGSMPGGTYNPNAQSSGMGDMGTTSPATLDLPKLYENLYANSGIRDIEGELIQREKEYNDAQMKINDNPWFSEADRVGRLEKLSKDYENRVANKRNEVAMKKADIETKLNLEMKQFDINSESARMALDRFNTLLSTGALNGASGEDIANITRSTGISSQAIQSAIKAQQQKNRDTQVITSTNDAGVVTAVVIDKSTGEVISSNSLGSIGNAQNGSSKASEGEIKAYYMNALREDAKKGLTLSQIFNLYTGHLEPNQIYQLYNSNSKYGADKGKIKNLEKYGVTRSK